MNLRKTIRDQKGFTLIELLVVITIIAILAAVMVPKLLGYTDKARVSRAKADLAAMKTIVEAYCADEGKGRYPDESDIGTVLNEKGIEWGGTDGIKDPWGRYYRYGTPSGNREFVFQSAGPDGYFDAGGDDIWCSSNRAYVQEGGTRNVSPNGWSHSSS